MVSARLGLGLGLGLGLYYRFNLIFYLVIILVKKMSKKIKIITNFYVKKLRCKNLGTPRPMDGDVVVVVNYNTCLRCWLVFRNRYILELIVFILKTNINI